MTRSVYVIGGAGTGKSTFTAELLEDLLGGLLQMGPLKDLHQKPNSRGTVITLRGHHIGVSGLYLGCMRDEFPGTDGLDRVSYIPGEEWLEGDLPEWILAEGATLAVRRFLLKLHETTELLLVHLRVDDFVKELRFAQRGSNQDPKFVLATETRSANLLADMAKAGVRTESLDSGDPEQWEFGLDLCHAHLQ